MKNKNEVNKALVAQELLAAQMLMPSHNYHIMNAEAMNFCFPLGRLDDLSSIEGQSNFSNIKNWMILGSNMKCSSVMCKCGRRVGAAMLAMNSLGSVFFFPKEIEE